MYGALHCTLLVFNKYDIESLEIDKIGREDNIESLNIYLVGRGVSNYDLDHFQVESEIIHWLLTRTFDDWLVLLLSKGSDFIFIIAKMFDIKQKN